VVCPDLRGYGDSDKPPGDPEHLLYSKRSLAGDQVELMQALGFDHFAVVGHDRGARVARRMALDHPDKVSHLALLDIVPTRTIYTLLNQERAAAVWRYFFLIQPYDFPERLIGAASDFYLRRTFEQWSGSPNVPQPEAMAEYSRCFDAGTIHASCEDYRAGASIDLTHDKDDSGKKIACPLLLLWSESMLGTLYPMADTWREQASHVQGHALCCGHFLPEEQPAEVVAELTSFLG
jgi:haloacetate dehalogenase